MRGDEGVGGVEEAVVRSQTAGAAAHSAHLPAAALHSAREGEN